MGRMVVRVPNGVTSNWLARGDFLNGNSGSWDQRDTILRSKTQFAFMGNELDYRYYAVAS